MEGSSSDHPPPKVPTIILNVLSPSTEEIPKKLTFTDIPVSTTVRSLKERIQANVAARPSLSRQRLIYQGKVLAADETSLKDIFGQEAISRSEPLSLHLVLSPAPAPPNSSSSSTSTPNPTPQPTGRQNNSTPLVLPHSNNLSSAGPTTQPNQQAAPQNAPNILQGPGQMPPGTPVQPLLFSPPQIPGQQGQAPLPPHLQNTLNAHLAAMNQQLAAHYAAQGQQQHLHQGMPHNHFQAHQWQQPMYPQPSFQQIIAQQQQARAAAGQHGLTQNPHALSAEQNRQMSNNAQGQVQVPSPNVNTVVRENQGPNGESFRMVIQSTSISRPNSGMGQRPHSQASNHNPHRPLTPANTGSHALPNTMTASTPAMGHPPGSPGPNFPAPNPLAMFQQRLSAIENSLTGGTAPPQSVFDHARTYLDNMARQPNVLPQGLETPLRTRLNNLSTQADQLRASLNSVLSQVLANQYVIPGMRPSNNPQAFPTLSPGESQREQQQPHTSVTPNTSVHFSPSNTASAPNQRPVQQDSTQPSPAPEVYLLSSPVGPHSLLVHHSGLYTTNLILPPVPTIPQFPPSNFNPFHVSQPNPSQQAPNAILNPNAQPNHQYQPPAAPQAPMHVAQAPQPQPQPQNPPRDLARILLPLGGHLWLLIRLFGFVYFFTAGGGHRRAILLGICAFIVFIANTGAFRPLFRALWEPMRRHVEGLVPLAAPAGERRDEQRHRRQQEQQQQQQQGRIENGAENDRNGNTGGANSNRGQEPDPQALADRLLRGQANASLFRRAERAIALFVASLVPGVGERHIAARDAAEARRVEEERQREDRALEEERQRLERGTSGDDQENGRLKTETVEGVGASGADVGDESTGAGNGLREREPRQGDVEA